jgi:NAD(P)-dependent dehydrogenase (short-subunit alcohol dehydrogenase family)
MRLKGKNVVITGASQGLGKELARRFLGEGADIAICARNAGLLNTARAELGAEFPSRRIFSQPCDVSKEEQVGAFVAVALNEFSRIDAVLLNAGIYGPMGATDTVPLDEWWQAMEVNVLGVLLPCRALIPVFKKQGGGKIIILSGGGATNPLPNISAYAASKAAVVRLAETLAEELRPFGIDVNCIAPGAMKTRMVEQVLEAGPEAVGQSFYEKNMKWADEGATPLDVPAGLAAYLASTESDGITGKLISAQWDPWTNLQEHSEELRASDIYCLRRIVPKDRGKNWG